MIALEFTTQTTKERKAELKPHISETVTISVKNGSPSKFTTYIGTFHSLVGTSLQVAVTDPDTGVEQLIRIAVDDILALSVHVGGNWSVKSEHKANSKFKTVIFRCSDAERTALVAAAKKQRISLSEYMRKIAIAATSKK